MSDILGPVAGARQDDLVGRWVLDRGRGGSVGFHTRHLFGLQAVHGTFQVSRAEVDVYPAGTADVQLDVDAASFSTGHKKRDPHVHSGDFLDVANNPHIGFVARGVDTSASSFTAPGTLTVRGAEAPVTIVGNVEHTGDGAATLMGSAKVDRYAVGLTKARGMASRWLQLEVVLPVRRA